MGRGGFEPPKQVAADLQSVPFGHSGICPLLQNYVLRKRVMGIEPTYPAWKAGVLPLNYTRKVPSSGIEPETQGFSVLCSTNWANWASCSRQSLLYRKHRTLSSKFFIFSLYFIYFPNHFIVLSFLYYHYFYSSRILLLATWKSGSLLDWDKHIQCYSGRVFIRNRIFRHFLPAV